MKMEAYVSKGASVRPLRNLARGVLEVLRHRYAGSFLGLAWAAVYPVILLSIYAVLYVVIFQIRAPGMSESEYIIFVFSGLVPLLAFSEMISSSTTSISSNREVVLNAQYAASQIPTRAVVAGQVSALFGMAATLLAALGLGTLRINLVPLLPIVWIMLVLFSLGIGYVLSLASLVYQDIRHGLSLVILVLFVVSPFAYTEAMVPPGLSFVMYLNPLTYFVTTFQDLVAIGVFPSALQWAAVCSLGIGVFAAGRVFFRRAQLVFFDYV